MGNWKGIGMPDKVKLFDLSKDIGEKNNIAADHPEIVKKISKIMSDSWVDPRSQKDDGKYTGKSGGSHKKKTR